MLGRVLLVVASSLSSLQIYHAIPCWLAVSAEKSGGGLVGVPLPRWWLFFPLLILSSLVFKVCQFDYCVSLCVPPWVYPTWDSLLPGFD